jgi:hypothetical protein
MSLAEPFVGSFGPAFVPAFVPATTERTVGVLVAGGSQWGRV